MTDGFRKLPLRHAAKMRPANPRPGPFPRDLRRPRPGPGDTFVSARPLAPLRPAR